MSGRGTLSIAVVLATVALLVTPALASGATPLRFGAKLNNTIQPSNAESGWWCDQPDPAPHPNCTWVSLEAYGRPNGGHKAPRNGIIDKVRVISCIPGGFRIQIAKARPAEQKARVLRNGPYVSFPGDPDDCNDLKYTVQVIDTHFNVNRGELIAIKTKRTGALRCSGGGTVLVFIPPLQAGGGLRTATDDESCFLLVEYQYD